MNDRSHTQANDLINAWLDGLLTADQEVELNAWVKQSPANATAFAKAVAFETRLGELCRSSRAISWPASHLEQNQKTERFKRFDRRRLTLAGGLAASVLIIMTVFWWQPSGRVNAAVELDRLIAIAPDSSDRTYRISNLDPYPEVADERRPAIDGAILYVRQPNSYVLDRKNADGSTFLTGCDGQVSWAVPPQGKVRVSRDLERFRGPLPGHQYGLPFVNLRTDLMQLRQGYDLAVLPQDQHGMKGLVGFKKSHDYRGPRQILIWYDAQSGVIRKMQFEGLPQARGGPASVAVELVDQGKKPAGFYGHELHHDMQREVAQE